MERDCPTVAAHFAEVPFGLAFGGTTMFVANLLGAFDGPDLLIILVIVMLLFGSTKLPGLARSLGEAKREFQSAITGSTPPVQEPPRQVRSGAHDDESTSADTELH
jgi:sec-independent protein translocase protein TatA